MKLAFSHSVGKNLGFGFREATHTLGSPPAPISKVVVVAVDLSFVTTLSLENLTVEWTN